MPDLKASELADPRERPFDDPAMSPESGAGVYSSAGDSTADTTPSQIAPTPRDVVGFVRMNLRGSAPRSPRTRSPHRRNRAKKWLKGSAIVGIRWRKEHRQGNPAPINHDVTLGSRLTSVCGVRTREVSTTHCCDARAVERGPTPIKSIRIVQAVEQGVVKSRPDSCVLPIPKTTPARHPALTTHLLWEHLPRDSGTQDEEDTRQDSSGRDAGPTAPDLWWLKREKRLNDLPQRVGHKRYFHARWYPRPTVSLPALSMSGCTSRASAC
jgi:hypothetical protein